MNDSIARLEREGRAAQPHSLGEAFDRVMAQLRAGLNMLELDDQSDR
jgi:hypothetical protein